MDDDGRKNSYDNARANQDDRSWFRRPSHDRADDASRQGGRDRRDSQRRDSNSRRDSLDRRRDSRSSRNPSRAPRDGYSKERRDCQPSESTVERSQSPGGRRRVQILTFGNEEPLQDENDPHRSNVRHSPEDIHQHVPNIPLKKELLPESLHAKDSIFKTSQMDDSDSGIVMDDHAVHNAHTLKVNHTFDNTSDVVSLGNSPSPPPEPFSEQDDLVANYDRSSRQSGGFVGSPPPSDHLMGLRIAGLAARRAAAEAAAESRRLELTVTDPTPLPLLVTPSPSDESPPSPKVQFINGNDQTSAFVKARLLEEKLRSEKQTLSSKTKLKDRLEEEKRNVKLTELRNQLKAKPR